MSENNGYTHYLEERVRLLTEQHDTQARNIRTLLERIESLESPERSISMPPILQALSNLDVGTVITWDHRYPRGDIYKFVAFLQKSNEWHVVSGKHKQILTHEALINQYNGYRTASLAGFKVLS